MWRILTVLVSGTFLWQLTNPSTSQTTASLPAFILPEVTHVAVISWVRTAYIHHQLLQVSSSNQVQVCMTDTGTLQLSYETFCSAPSKDKTRGKWQQLVLRCSPDSCCLRYSLCGRGLELPGSIRVELGSIDAETEFLNAQLIAGSNEQVSQFLLEDFGAKAHDYILVIPAFHPLHLDSIHWEYCTSASTATIGVSGWFRLEGSSFNNLFTAKSSGCTPCGVKAFCGTNCELVELHEAEGMLQVCEQRGYHVYCMDSLSVDKIDWTYVSLAVTTESLHICVAQLWQPVRCLRTHITGLPSAQEHFKSLWFDGPCLYALDVRVYFTSFEPLETASIALEEQETACIHSCAMTSFHSSCLQRRKLTTTHFSGITWQGYMANANDNYYFTFFNTHVSTDYIDMIGDSFGCNNCDPDLYIYKPWNGVIAAFDWQMINWLTSQFILYPNDPLLPSKGGIQGLYTLRVYGYNAPWPFEVRVRIACSSPSIVPCSCSTGTYYNSLTNVCTACPSGNLICPYAASSGCLSYSDTTSATSNFNCDVCFVAGTYLSSTGTCLPCNSNCATCVGSSAAQCLTCPAGTSLSGASGSSTCLCPSGYYPNPSASSCTVCNVACLTCSGGASSDCTSCYPQAQLSSGSSSACVCSDGTYTPTTPAVCVPCDLSCLTCTAAGPTGCITCFPNAHKSAGTCVCDNGFYPAPTVMTCQLCHYTCSLCVTGDQIGCLACLSHATLQSSPGPGRCVCQDGYYLSATSCQLCNSACRLCSGSGPTDCTGCFSIAEVENNFAIGRCLCPSGSFPDPSPALCSPCDQTCSKCTGRTSQDCLACMLLAELKGNTCICVTTAYPSPHAGNCLPCNSACSTCSGGGEARCVTCGRGAQLAGPYPNSCVCVEGFYMGISGCVTCSMACQICTAQECQRCIGNAFLQAGACACPDQYYLAAEGCVACGSGCQICSQSVCSICLSGFFYYSGQCLTKCPYSYHPDSLSHCQPVDISPPVPLLSVSHSNDLFVSFNKVMSLASIRKTDLNVVVVTPQQDELTVNWADPDFDGNSSFSLKLVMEGSYLPANSTVTLSFLDLTKITDIYSIQCEVRSLTAGLFAVGSAPPASVLQTSIGTSTSTATSGGAASGATMSLLNGNPGSLITLVNQMQLITYIGMTKLELPQDLSATISGVNMGISLPNPFHLDAQTTSPPAHVSSYGLDSLLFISNAGSVLGTCIFVLLSYIPVYFLSKVKSASIASYFSAMIPSLFWNTPMRLWMTSYLDLGVFSFLQLVYADQCMQTWGGRVSVVCALICGLGILATPFLIASFTLRNYPQLAVREDEEFTKRWGSVLAEFRPGDSPAVILFYCFFALRRVVLFLSLTLLVDLPELILPLNVLASFSVIRMQTLFYLVRYHPYQLPLDQRSSVANESLVLVVYLSVGSFIFRPTGKVADFLSAVGVWATRSAIFANLAISLYRTACVLSSVFKIYRKMLPNYSHKTTLGRKPTSLAAD